jgi:hypothetical protein
MNDALEKGYPSYEAVHREETDDYVNITKKEYELFEKLKKIWFHTQPDKSGLYFICGEGGDHDTHGLPDTILVCPHAGINTTAIYRKEKVGRSGQ